MSTNSQPASGPIALIAAQIVEESIKPDVEVSKLSSLAQCDPAFAAKLLTCVNSAAFGLSRRVTDVRQAVSLIGIRSLRNLGLSLALSDMVPAADGVVLLANCIRRAAAARCVARATRLCDPDAAFTLGLFLEVGLLVRARDDFQGALELARRPAHHRPLLERADGIRPHQEVGAEFASSFRLSDDVVDAIRVHHVPEPPDSPLGRIAWAAERLAGVFESHGATTDDALACLELVGLSRQEAGILVAGFPVEFAAAASLLDRELEPQRSIEELAAGAHQALVNLNLEYESVLRRLEQVMAEKELVADELRSANARLSAAAATDSLTELPNNRAFREALARELARSVRAKTPVSLIMVDIDFFKRVNDTYGHAAGDETLRAVAQRLRGALRAGDMPARYGGEEFVVLLPVTEIEGARVVAERLRNAIAAAPVVLEDGTSLPVTASFGVAVTMAGPPDSSELFNRADSALYVAKRGGRNRVEVERSEAARPSELTEQCVA